MNRTSMSGLLALGLAALVAQQQIAAPDTVTPIEPGKCVLELLP